MVRGDRLKTSHSPGKGRMGLLLTWHLSSGPCMQATLIWNLQAGRSNNPGLDVSHTPVGASGIQLNLSHTIRHCLIVFAARFLHDRTRCPSSIPQGRSTLNNDTPLSTPPATGIWNCTQHWVADVPRLRQVSNSVAELPS